MNSHCQMRLILPLFCLIILFINITSIPCIHARAGPTPKQIRNLYVINQFLGAQNAARSSLGMRPLVWDTNLANYAQSYANHRRWDCALVHSNGPYGENIFWGSGSGWTPAQAAAAWVSERQWYNYWSNSCANGRECGHYTQIIWRDSWRIGCAMVTCVQGKGVFMICNYDPPGNYIGEKPY